MHEHMSLMTAYWYGFLGGTMFCLAIWRAGVMIQRIKDASRLTGADRE